MSDYLPEICNCPECHYYDIFSPHCCGLPERLTAEDGPHIRNAVSFCRCVNPDLWRLYESLEVR